MRIALLLSAVFHAALLGALAVIVMRGAEWEMELAQGQTVSLRVTMATEASAAPAATEVDVPPETPPEPTPQVPRTERPLATSPTGTEPPAPVDHQPTETTTPPIVKRATEVTQHVPMPGDAPPTTVIPRHPGKSLEPSVETSVAFAFTNADIGIVDEMPRKHPGNPAPPYPSDALFARLEGRVVLRVKIAASGTVERAQLEKSSGVESLDNSALATVRTWRFFPAKRTGAAVAHEVLVPVNFRIRD
jgi:protein TonB